MTDKEHPWADAVVVATWPDGMRLLRLLDAMAVNRAYHHMGWFGGVTVAISEPWATDPTNSRSSSIGMRKPTVFFLLEDNNEQPAAFVQAKWVRGWQETPSRWIVDYLHVGMGNPGSVVDKRLRGIVFDLVFGPEVDPVFPEGDVWERLPVISQERTHRIGVPMTLPAPKSTAWNDQGRILEIDRATHGYERAIEGLDSWKAAALPNKFTRVVSTWLYDAFGAIFHDTRSITGGHEWVINSDQFDLKLLFTPSKKGEDHHRWAFEDLEYGITIVSAPSLIQLRQQLFWIVPESDIDTWLDKYVEDGIEDRMTFDNDLYRITGAESPLFWDIPEFDDFARMMEMPRLDMDEGGWRDAD